MPGTIRIHDDFLTLTLIDKLSPVPARKPTNAGPSHGVRRPATFYKTGGARFARIISVQIISVLGIRWSD